MPRKVARSWKLPPVRPHQPLRPHPVPLAKIMRRRGPAGTTSASKRLLPDACSQPLQRFSPHLS
jgi:hypothetical protein